MATKTVRVILPAFDFQITAGSTHEAAAVVLGRLEKLKQRLPPKTVFLVLLNGQHFEVSKEAAEEWILHRSNPRCPADVVAYKRWKEAVEGQA